MIYALYLLVLLLFVVIIIQYQRETVRKKNIAFLQEELKRLVQNDGRGRLLLRTEDEQIRGLLIELNELLGKYNKAHADNVEAEEAMKKMIANIAHDFKTPLTVILGYAELLNYGLDGKYKEIAYKLHGKSKELVAFVNEFFDMTKLESGEMDVEMEKIDCCDISRNTMISFYELCMKKNLDVQLQIPEAPIYVMGNMTVLERILNNLISNSIKYGSDGQVIGLSVVESEDQVVICVWDKGKGIAESHVKHVFDRLYTLEDSRNRQNQGSGLGLSITKRLVEYLDGSIELESIPYEQTVFRIKLPKIKFKME